MLQNVGMSLLSGKACFFQLILFPLSLLSSTYSCYQLAPACIQFTINVPDCQLAEMCNEHFLVQYVFEQILFSLNFGVFFSFLFFGCIKVYDKHFGVVSVYVIFNVSICSVQCFCSWIRFLLLKCCWFWLNRWN